MFGRGVRQRADVDYTDHLTEKQWMKVRQSTAIAARLLFSVCTPPSVCLRLALSLSLPPPLSLSLFLSFFLSNSLTPFIIGSEKRWFKVRQSVALILFSMCVLPPPPPLYFFSNSLTGFIILSVHSFFAARVCVCVCLCVCLYVCEYNVTYMYTGH